MMLCHRTTECELSVKKEVFSSRDLFFQEQVALSICGVSVCGDLQKPPGHIPGQPAFGDLT